MIRTPGCAGTNASSTPGSRPSSGLRVDADRDLAGTEALPQRYLLFQLADVAEQVFAARHQPLAQLGQDEPAAAPVEELRSELLLEARDALRQGGLGQV